ncbi:unnamed protein product [Ceutorhynchus assimilis]|uniref:DUS-like FMN-binding domain-containing protein n=1 Tax=Ceutorhynchus assimilis TaxID=467358 RepID=A0A9N9QRN4_9CUCU|nr:unnamed protein product [Ceutorhynchus assimilis]
MHIITSLSLHNTKTNLEKQISQTSSILESSRPCRINIFFEYHSYPRSPKKKRDAMAQKQSTDILELFNQKPLVKICAPMVRYTKLQFRTLLRQYDCDLVFTPMILADSFCKSPKARNNEFTTNLLDTPLITQFAANNVHDFVGASYLAAPHCDGVDLNCGCPQRWAKDMNLGCELLKTPQKIFQLVRECRNRIAKPFTVSVKTRIQKCDKDNVYLCKELEKCGVSFVTIHARTASNNVGPINEDALKLISESVQIPIIGNGGITNLESCYELQEKTGIKGVMVANGILNNPEIFMGVKVTSMECVQEWLDICYNSTLTLEVFDKTVSTNTTVIPEKPFNLTFQCFHHHLVFMLDKILSRRQRQIFNNLKTFSSTLDFLNENFGLRPQLFARERFLKTMPLKLNYDSRNSVYEELKPEVEEAKVGDFITYDYDKCDGKYFKSYDDIKKLNNSDCDWSNIFIENG